MGGIGDDRRRGTKGKEIGKSERKMRVEEESDKENRKREKLGELMSSK